MGNRTNRNGSQGATFRRLARSDLTNFDQQATELILGAIEIGCRGRISSKGHCILHNNTGGTTSVPRNMTSPNRSAQNARSDVKKLMSEHRRHEEPDQRKSRPTHHHTTVAQAFVDYGSTFSTWFDAHPNGLPADAALDVRVDPDGTCHFSCDQADQQAEAPASQGSQSAESVPTESTSLICEHCGQSCRTPAALGSHKRIHRRKSPEVSTHGGDDPLQVLAEVRRLIGPDPQIAELIEENKRLRAQIHEQDTRLAETEARLALIQEAFNA